MAYDPNPSEDQKRGALTGKPVSQGAGSAMSRFTDSIKDALDNFLQKARDANKAEEFKRENLGRGEGDKGFIRSSANVTREANREIEIKHKKEGEESVRRAGDRALERLYKNLEEINRQIEFHQEKADAASEFLEFLRNGGELELDENGELKNERQEQVLRDYEARTGKKVDRTDRDAVIVAVTAEEKSHTETVATLKDWREKGKALANSEDMGQVRGFNESFESQQILNSTYLATKNAETRRLINKEQGIDEHSAMLESGLAAEKEDVLAEFMPIPVQEQHKAPIEEKPVQSEVSLKSVFKGAHDAAENEKAPDVGKENELVKVADFSLGD